MKALASAPDYFRTTLGRMVHGDSKDFLGTLEPDSVDLIVTSPPYALLRKKAYGNANADCYLDWFRPFAKQFKRILRPHGSLVIDIGGTWLKGTPTRSLYQYHLLIMLVQEFGFHLAEEFFWWNPAKLPTPAEWVTIRRIRAKDAVDFVWWLSPTPWPKASNRRVPVPYGETRFARVGGIDRTAVRPSGHRIGSSFLQDNGHAIPSNLLAIPHTESNSAYLRYCRSRSIVPHPARFPTHLPEFFIRMLTDCGDTVLDPFAGSCATGEVAERLQRRWICVEAVDDYLRGALGRFCRSQSSNLPRSSRASSGYLAHHPAAAWKDTDDEHLSRDGGRTHVRKVREAPGCEGYLRGSPDWALRGHSSLPILSSYQAA